MTLQPSGTDHGCDSGNDAGSRVRADASRAALHSESPVARDRRDEQAEHEALQNPGDDIANEQRILYRSRKYGNAMLKLHFLQTRLLAESGCKVRNRGETRRQQKRRKHPRRSEKP